MKTSTDRRKKMTMQFEREGLEVEFIEAVAASDLNEHANIKRGEYANVLGHQKIWKEIIENNHEFALVFEDQCKLMEGFSNVLATLQLPERWDIIYLGYTGPRFFASENDQLDRGKPVGTWCHLVSREGAKKLVNLNPLDYWLIPDTQLAFMPLSTFYIKNKIAWRDSSSKSIIGSNYIERGILKWLVLGHWGAHIFQFWPVLEIIFILLIILLVIRLRK